MTERTPRSHVPGAQHAEHQSALATRGQAPAALQAPPVQTAIGNQAALRALGIGTTSVFGSPDDSDGHRARRPASAFVSTSGSNLERQQAASPRRYESALSGTFGAVAGAERPEPQLDGQVRALGRSLGQDFRDVEVRLGNANGSGQGAYTASSGARDVIAFDRSSPSREQLAHELVHVTQRRRFGAGQRGLESGESASEVEARQLAPRLAGGEAVEVRAAPAARVQRDDVVAQRIHDNLHGLVTDDEEAALQELRDDHDRAETCRAYQQLFDDSLWGDFIDNASGDTLHQALALLWPHMTLLERLDTMTGADDDEDGIMQTIRNASDDEVTVARDSIQPYLDELDVADQYTMRCRIWPEDPVANVAWLLSAGSGWVWDDEGPVASAILSLAPAERVQLWGLHEDLITSMFSSSDSEQIRRMCITDSGETASDTDALRVRMELATEGAGTDESGVAAAIAIAGSRRNERARIVQALESGLAADGTPLTETQRSDLERRRDEIGDVEGELLSPTEAAGSGELDPDSFLGRVEGDVDAGTVDAALATAHASAFERAKQALLLTQGFTSNVDEDAVLHILRGIGGEVTLAPGETIEGIGPVEARRRRAASAADIVQRLVNDTELSHIFAALDAEELGYATDLAAGDTYQATLRDLRIAYEGFDTDEAAILRLLRDASAEDRARMQAEGPDPIPRIRAWAGADTPFRRAFEQTLESGVIPTEEALDEALGGSFDTTNVELLNEVLAGLSAADRAQLRRGYLLAHRPRAPGTGAEAGRDSMAPPREAEPDADQIALARYRSLYDRLESELSAEELDVALVAMLDIPTVEEMTAADGSGRVDAAEIMLYRQRERLALNAGVILDAVTTTDDTAAAAHVEFEARYNVALEDGEISAEEFAVLVNLDTQFNDRFREYSETADMAAEIAGTVAAVVAAAVVIVLSGGTAAAGAPGVIAWLSANSTLIGTSAAASALSQVVVSEAVGGEFNEAIGAEGARQALSGAINGALAVCGAALAERAATLVGLSGPSLTATIARAAAESVEISAAGRGFARGALVGLIDGSLGGAVGEFTMTLADARTWRHDVWGVMAQAGGALLRGGLLGGLTGTAAGGMLEMIQGVLRARALSDVAVSMDAPGSRVHIEYDLTPDGAIDRLALRFGPETTDADLVAHVERIVSIRRASGFLSRARAEMTVSGDAAHEVAKIPDMVLDRLRQLHGDIPLARRDILEAEIDVLQSNFDEFSRIARAGDMTEGTGRIARPDAPFGYPDPPPGHYYRRRGAEWDLQRRPGADVTPRAIVSDGSGGWTIVDRAELTGGPVVPAVVGEGAAHAPSAQARAEMEAIGTRRLEEMAARDFAESEVDRLRGVLGLTDEEVSGRNIDATIARLRGEHANDPGMLAQIDDLARHRGALTDARRELTQASELLGNTAAMDVMQARGATRLYGNPTPPGRSGEFDFIYVLRDGDGNISHIFVVEAKGASSTLGSAEFAGVRAEQGSATYLEGIARGMLENDGSELDQVLQRIINRSGEGPDVSYLLVQAPVNGAGVPLPPVVSEFAL